LPLHALLRAPRVSQNEGQNKMSLHNLATVFGPTLLRPAAKEEAAATLEMFSAQARDAMTQTAILLHYLATDAAAAATVTTTDL
jgi:hypothetical protein